MSDKELQQAKMDNDLKIAIINYLSQLIEPRVSDVVQLREDHTPIFDEIYQRIKSL